MAKVRVALFVGEELVQRYVDEGQEDVTRAGIIAEAVATGRFRDGSWVKSGVPIRAARALVRSDGSPVGITYVVHSERGGQLVAKVDGKRSVMTARTPEEIREAYAKAVGIQVKEYGLNDLQRSVLDGAFGAFCKGYSLGLLLKRKAGSK